MPNSHPERKSEIEETKNDNNLNTNSFASPATYAKRFEILAQKIREGDESPWYFYVPQINPMMIIEQAKFSPMLAAHWCQRACIELSYGYHTRVREYLVAAYAIACEFRLNEKAIAQLAIELKDGRAMLGRGIKPDKIEQKLLHYVFMFIFYQNGVTTRNRANQYALSLQPFFDEKRSSEEVASRLAKYGQDRLYRTAAQFKKLIEGAQAWEAQEKNLATVSLDEILANMPTREKVERFEDSDETQVIDSRELPSDTRDLDEIEADQDLIEIESDVNEEYELEFKEAPLGLEKPLDTISANTRIDSLAFKTIQIGTMIAGDGISSIKQKLLIDLTFELAAELLSLKNLDDERSR